MHSIVPTNFSSCSYNSPTTPALFVVFATMQTERGYQHPVFLSFPVLSFHLARRWMRCCCCCCCAGPSNGKFNPLPLHFSELQLARNYSEFSCTSCRFTSSQTPFKPSSTQLTIQTPSSAQSLTRTTAAAAVGDPSPSLNPWLPFIPVKRGATTRF